MYIRVQCIYDIDLGVTIIYKVLRIVESVVYVYRRVTNKNPSRYVNRTTRNI